VLGIWFQGTEGAKFWLAALTELKQRGLEDVLVCCVDGLSGFSEAIEAVYPEAWVQTCPAHQVRQRLRFVPYRDRRAVARDLKRIYTTQDRGQAERELAARLTPDRAGLTMGCATRTCCGTPTRPEAEVNDARLYTSSTAKASRWPSCTAHGPSDWLATGGPRPRRVLSRPRLRPPRPLP